MAASLSWRIIVIGILGVLAAGAAVLLLLRIRFELAGAYHTDASIYLTVSRGILNGLTPYADLYENKPPGIFLLGALSLWLFDDAQLLLALQALVIALLPFCVVMPVASGEGFPGIRGQGRPRLLFAWLIGCALALFTALMAGTLLPESFGAFFGSAFIAVTASRERITWPVSIVLAVLLMSSAGIKEPFFLSTMAGVLVVLPSWKSLKRIVPAVLIAVAVGLQAMLLLGYLWPYVTVNLAHLLGFHVFNPWGTVGEPLWLRLIDIPRIAVNMASVSPALPLLIGPLWLAAFLFLLRRVKTTAARVSAAGRWVFASLLATLSVGLTGDFYGHHFIFAVPFYTGCALTCLRAWPGDLPRRVCDIILIAFAAALAWMLLTIPVDYTASLRSWEHWAAPRRTAAAVLDRVMDDCEVDRYFDVIDRPEGFYGFTRHSPYGPIFTQYGRFVGALQVYLDGFGRALQEAPIAVMTTEEDVVPMDSVTRSYFQESFTEKPWACAGEIPPIPPYRLLFRKEG